jgi:hypothetical protein
VNRKWNRRGSKNTLFALFASPPSGTNDDASHTFCSLMMVRKTRSHAKGRQHVLSIFFEDSPVMLFSLGLHSGLEIGLRCCIKIVSYVMSSVWPDGHFCMLALLWARGQPQVNHWQVRGDEMYFEMTDGHACRLKS